MLGTQSKNPLLLFWGLIIFFLQTNIGVNAQSKAALELEDKVYDLNNAFKYDQSQTTILRFLANAAITDDDSYYGYLYLSYTYKRLFDYKAAMEYLDKALECGIKTNKADFYTANINCQKALAYFDIHEYNAADSLMKSLAKEHYKHLDDEYKSKIFMQEAYLLGLKHRYPEAEIRYNLAIAKLKIASPCDLPMIYGKQIQLYGAEKNEQKMYEVYKKSIESAAACQIYKYTLYTNETMADAFEKMGDYKAAFFYLKLYDSINNIYNAKDHLNKITELGKKYEAEKKEQQIALQKKTIESKNSFIGLLISSIAGLVLVLLLIILKQKQKKLMQEKQNAISFTKQLFQKTEEERKRIASDLHDSVSHELLALKTLGKDDFKTLGNNIDDIINNIRVISRNLHPVMFDKVGLRNSIEQMAQRVQQQHNFMLTADVTYANALPLPSELQVYRIVQEAVNNMVKYANAVAGKITITEKGNGIGIEIKDNGKGFNVPETLAGESAFGLHNIIERSRAIGGTAKIFSGGNGTVIIIDIPINLS